MGLGEEHEPPKKKLKQAQLCFTPINQKRKLDVDLDDDVQIVKIVCKETSVECDSLNVSDKENQLSVNKLLSTECDKRLKRDSDSSGLNLVESSQKTKKTSESCEINIPSSETKISETTKTNRDESQEFSLSISDSVLDVINRKSLTGDDQDQPKDTNSCSKDSGTLQSSNSPSVSSEEEGEDKEDCPSSDSDRKATSLTPPENSDVFNKTVNSEEEVISLSSSHEESPEKKNSSSPTTPGRKLTPKRLESLKKREERERLKLERKAQRARQKEEKIKFLEEEKRKKKEEKEKKRQTEQRLKEEEKKLKEEERKKREEEKKQKEEEKKRKDEEKRKREEAKEEEKRKKEEIEEKKKAAFAKFFKKNKLPETAEKIEEVEEYKFMPFPMKPDMRLANDPRRLLTLEEKENLEKHLIHEKETDKCSYLNDLKSGNYIPKRTEGTWPLSAVEEEHDVIIIESTENGDCVDLTTTNEPKEHKRKMRAKLLQFHDNRRPPYWGTWRKSSKAVGPRNPFGQDKKIFDYEVDSDSEWEDEGEGEDIDKEEGADSEGEQSGDEEEAVGENGYVLDNTFVPHGYLSDEEVQPDEDIEDNDPESQKLRMKLLKQEFDEEMTTKTERLKPRLLGCVYISNGTTEVSSGSLYEGLMAYRTIWNEEEGPIDVTGPLIEDSPTSTPQTKKIFPPQVLPLLAKFVHESQLPMSVLVKEFISFIEKEHPSEHVSKRAVTLKIKEIATKTYDYSTGKPTWGIKPSLCEEFGLKAIATSNPVPAPPPPLPPVVEKPKDNPLLTYLKGVQTPPMKKKVPFITLPSSSSYDYTPSKLNDTGGVKYFGTPRPVDPVLKKRAQLITLSTSVENKNKDPTSVKTHKELKGNEVIDLCDGSQ